MLALQEAGKRQLRERHFLWNAVCGQLRLIFPIAWAVSKVKYTTIMQSPMDAAYGGTSAVSLISLLAAELESCTVDPARPHLDPYHDFLECAEDLHQHLRHISDIYDLGNSSMLYALIELVGQVSKIFLHAINNPVRTGYEDEQDLVNELKWQLSFLSNVFYNKTIVDHNYATNATDIAAYVGLRAIESDIFDLAKECRDIIVSITKSWARVGIAENRYGNLTDSFFESLWMFSKAAELKGMPTVAEHVNNEINDLLVNFTPEQQGEIRQRLERGAERINEEIDDYNFRSSDIYCTINILRRIADNPEVQDNPA